MDVKFDPNAPGPLKVILEQDDPSYFETRAMELISEAKIIRMGARVREVKVSEYNETMIRVMRMLLMARHSLGE
jgi:hypothetical protein